jgi:hypothetical protein
MGVSLHHPPHNHRTLISLAFLGTTATAAATATPNHRTNKINGLRMTAANRRTRRNGVIRPPPDAVD